jgi:hypothetical protein
MDHELPPLLALPAELIHQILSYLPSSTLLSILPVNTVFAASVLSCIRSRIHKEAPLSSSPIYLSFVPPALSYARRSAICTHIGTPGLDRIDCPSSDYYSDSGDSESDSASDSEPEFTSNKSQKKLQACSPSQDIIRRVKALHALCTRYSVCAPTTDLFEPLPRSTDSPAWTSEAPRFAIDHPDERFTTALARVIVARKGWQKKWAIRLFRSFLMDAARNLVTLAEDNDDETHSDKPVELWFGERNKADAGVLIKVERSPAREGLVGWQREDPREEWYQLRVLGKYSR